MSDRFAYWVHAILGAEVTALLYMVWKLYQIVRDLKAEIQKRGK